MSIRMAGKPRLATIVVIAAANVATLTTAVVALPATEAHGTRGHRSERHTEYAKSVNVDEISQVIADYSAKRKRIRREGR
ncbi:hypothetical protein [Actinoallomurus sp. CA-150999]|uniref:hypothetical protein n=1 Tax=Actinoallomurus sp. CA-150999 TaxID=3239887 RepID=UPI003D8AC9D7